MSQSHRKEVAKKLKEAIAEATDPNVIAQLSNQLSKYLPRPKQARRRRGTQPTVKAKKPSDVVAKWAERLSHVPEEKRIEFSVILEVEEKQRQRGKTLTETERKTLLQELMGSLTAEERAMVNGESADIA